LKQSLKDSGFRADTPFRIPWPSGDAAPLKPIALRDEMWEHKVVTVTMPDDFRELLDEREQPDKELRTRLSAHFYSVGSVGIAKAADMAGMTRWEFERWLHAHGVEMPWREADLAQELSSVRKFAGE
jgi:predicted HTH domain antitoxin